jgi:MoaA/NifB/PqqE/SkfB family radical SAM enzyme
MEMTVRETKNRLTLQEKKPLAYAKIIKHPEKILKKECVAMIQLQYNYLCNMRCKHCSIERLKNNPGKNQLTVPDVKRIADQADAIGLGSICITGGEPLMFPDLKEVMEAIGPERFVISMDTNGWLLTEEKVKWLAANGLDRIHLSMDGLAENHAKFRKTKGSWERNLKAIEYCKAYGLDTIINIVATKSLVISGELIKQLDYIAQFGVHASIIYAKPIGSFEDSKNEILNTEDLAFIQSLTSKYNCSTHLSLNCGHYFGCLCLKRHLSISASGDLLPCPWIPITLGNIFEEDLATIINRGLEMPWFSYDHQQSCLCGNEDTFFYKNIMPQINKATTYPVKYTEIDWHLDKA